MDLFRAKKVSELQRRGRIPYASTFARSGNLAEAKALKDGKECKVAGRVMLLRDMGGMMFLSLQDYSGTLQVAFREDVLGKEKYTEAVELVDRGDFVGIAGEHFTTKKGEPTILAREWTMLSKALRQPPEKWHGVVDQETVWRQRYLDLLSNPETFDRFQFRSLFLQKMREFYWNHSFTEVETPVLVNAASGALAKPFLSHHDAYDLDVYLRIAPETFLKECLIGGFDRVFEVARCFRNEGLDPSHLQDFTMVEHYAAFWDYQKNMTFTEEMFGVLVEERVKIPNREGEMVEVNFRPPWPRVSIRDAVKDACGIDLEQSETAEALRTTIRKANVTLDVPIEILSRGNLIDQLYKKVARPHLVQPTFITEHPLDLSPLARRNDDNPSITDRFQLVVGGWEVVNAYSELVDPVDQAERLEEQAKAHAKGDTAAHKKDDEYVKALEYGCPPCSGWGMGVDRIVALLTQQKNVRDVVLFPLMKPLKEKISSFPVRSMAANTPLLLQHAEYGYLLPAAHGLLAKHADKTRAHLLATGAVMETLAKRFGGDPTTWKVAGMLHDLDWDHLEKDAEEHCGQTLEHMLAEVQAPTELLADIRSHYEEKYGAEHPLDSELRKCLYCVDELTGFIIAVTLVKPSKDIADVEVSSVKKKMKDKAFARQVKREQIMKCDELLGIPLDEFISITLETMKSISEDIGLP